MDETTVTVSLYTVQQNGILPPNRCPAHWTMMISQYILNRYWIHGCLCGTFCKARKIYTNSCVNYIQSYKQTNTWCLLLQACRRNAALLKRVQSYKTGLKSIGRRRNKTEVLFCFVFFYLCFCWIVTTCYSSSELTERSCFGSIYSWHHADQTVLKVPPCWCFFEIKQHSPSFFNIFLWGSFSWNVCHQVVFKAFLRCSAEVWQSWTQHETLSALA